MKRALKLFFFLLLLTTAATAAHSAREDHKTLFEEANRAYSAGKYDRATELYQHIISSQGYSVPLLMNLGHSYGQLQQTGRAILSYERALRLSPGNPDIASNLELVRKESGLFEAEKIGLEKFFATLTLQQWSILLLITASILALFHLITLRFPAGRKKSLFATIASCLVIVVSGIGIYSQNRYNNPSIVIENGTRLQISPFEKAASSGAIQSGRRVYPIKTHNSFTYVRDETGRKGWIATGAIVPVIPPARE